MNIFIIKPIETFIFNKMTGGWKQKSGWIQIPPASCVPFTFPFLSQPSVCLIVSRVRAYLTTDQQVSQG